MFTPVLAEHTKHLSLVDIFGCSRLTESMVYLVRDVAKQFVSLSGFTPVLHVVTEHGTRDFPLF